MKWNYRVVRKEKHISIHEVYYDENGNAISISQNPVAPEAEDIKELKDTLELMMEAISKEILEYSAL